jgi:hypothetical protein
MLVEHRFITLLEGAEALARAIRLLEAKRCRITSCTDRSVKLQRDGKRPGRAPSVNDMRLVAQVDFDRGRVDVAADLDNRRRADALVRDYLVVLAHALESLLGASGTIEEALGSFGDVEARIAREGARRRLRRRIWIGVLVALIALCIVLIVAAVRRF